MARDPSTLSAARSMILGAGVAMTLITATAPPLTVATLGAWRLQHQLTDQALVGVGHIQEVKFPPTLAAHNLAHIKAALWAMKGADSELWSSWITDSANSVLAFEGQRSLWPVLHAQAPLNCLGLKGQLHVAVSTQRLISMACQVAVFSIGLALLVFYCFVKMPLRVLDNALRLLTHEKQRVENKRSQLQIQNMRFNAALAHMAQGLCMFDRNQRLIVCNKEFYRLYGLTAEQAHPGMHLEDVLKARIANGTLSQEAADACRSHKLEPGTSSVCMVSTLQDGRSIAVTRTRMADGGWVGTHQDITEQREQAQKIAHLAKHDFLTNLPNRALLHEELSSALLRVRQRGGTFAVMCLDLDRFKAVNDTLGHHDGDKLLVCVAERLRSCLRSGDVAARTGGDEFSIIQQGENQPADALAVASRIVEVLSEPYKLGDHTVIIGTSVGIAVAPVHGTDGDVLLHHADLALYRAKGEGRGTARLFSAEMEEKKRERQLIEAELQDALHNQELHLVYQPMFRLSDEQICGFEALLRWTSPTRGAIAPVEFIPVAEEIGLIERIGEWVLREACREAATWPGDPRIAVNVSARQLLEGKLPQLVMSALAASGLAPHRLELELTESILITDTQKSLAVLNQLHDIGVNISIDDFGTGYSSLSYLQKFPFDKIKLDRSFVAALNNSECSAVIVRAVADMGGRLGLSTAVEGVETAEQLARVKAEGFGEVQGFLFSRPVLPADARRLLGMSEEVEDAEPCPHPLALDTDLVNVRRPEPVPFAEVRRASGRT